MRTDSRNSHPDPVRSGPFHVVLVEPEIPPNTGTVARLCAAVRCPLHLVGELGFRLDERRLRRAGLDYWPWVDLRYHESLATYLDSLEESGGRPWLFTTAGDRLYTSARFRPGDHLVFGSETRGLPAELHARFPDRRLRIPILESAVRSLNLATAVAIGLYEALRQCGFDSAG